MSGYTRWILVVAVLASVPAAPSAQAQSFSDLAVEVIREVAANTEPGRRSGPSATRRAETPWLVIASREDPQEAVALAESYVPTIGATAVIQSRNGRFAIVAGTLNRDKAKPNVEALKALRLIPQDSFLSDGQNFERVIWHSFEAEGSLDLMNRPAYRQSVRRLQAAFSRLSLYQGPIDGLVGPSTGEAFSVYVEKYGAPFGDVVDTYALSSIEETAADGFRNREERDLARARGFQNATTYQEAEAGGFPSALAFNEARALGFRSQDDWDQAMSGGFRRNEEYVRAKAGGFSTATAYRDAQRDGFETAREHETFRESGFSDAQEFRLAQQGGFKDKASYQRAQADKLKATRNEGQDLLSDADAFVRLNPQTPNLLDIAAEAATLKGGMGTASTIELAATILRLRTALSDAPGFGAFEAARGDERVRQAAARRTELQAELEATRAQLATWVAANLTSAKLPGIVAELKLLTQDVKSADLDVLLAARDRAVSAIQKQGLANEIELLTHKEPSTSPVAESLLPQAVSITPANRVLLQGEPDDVVVLYNAGTRAPSLARNLIGAFAFRNGKASICATGVSTTPALQRALLGELARFDGKELALSASDCGPMDVRNRDILLIQRRAFLAASPSVAVPFLEALESGSIRVFDDMPFSAITRRMNGEANLAAAIEADVAAGRRNGYGALLLAKGAGPICAVVAEDTAAHRDMLDRVSRYAMTEIDRVPTTRFATLDETFLSAKAEECRLVYGSEHSLKLLFEGLKRDGREVSFVPLWYERKALQDAVVRIVKAHQEELRQAEERRLAAEGERSDADRVAASKAQTREAKEAELRARYSAEAAALLNVFSQGLKKRVLEQPSAILKGEESEVSTTLAHQFPNFEEWRGALSPQDWRPIAMDVAIADYGMAEWKKRSLEAIAVEARVQIVSRERGEYKEACFLLAAIVDGEFEMYRDAFEGPCESVHESLDRWKIGHDFKSRWVAQ